MTRLRHVSTIVALGLAGIVLATVRGGSDRIMTAEAQQAVKSRTNCSAEAGELAADFG